MSDDDGIETNTDFVHVVSNSTDTAVTSTTNTRTTATMMNPPQQQQQQQQQQLLLDTTTTIVGSPPPLPLLNATLDASHIAYLVPSNTKESILPISIASHRSYRTNNNSSSCSINNNDNNNSNNNHAHPTYLMVGRQSSTSDIRIQHNSISRSHATLYYTTTTTTTTTTDRNDNDSNDNKILTIQDLGSKYGTTINGHRISGRTLSLHINDTIRFGNAQDTIYTVQMNPTKLLEEDVTTTTTTTTTSTELNTTFPIEVASEPIVYEIKDHDDETRNDTTTPTNHETSREHQSSMTNANVTTTTTAGIELIGRAKHEAEIAAMISSFDQIPTYTTTTTNNVLEIDDNNYIDPLDMTTTRTTTEQQSTHTIAIQYRIPIASHMIYESTINTTTATVRRNVPTCMAIDPVGTRCCMGCTNATIQVYDFGSRRRTSALIGQSIKSFIPDEGYWPISCTYSTTGDRMIIGTGSVQPSIVNREGEIILQFIRGDMYVTDQSKTVGHTAAVTCVDWHPFQRDVVITSSMDGSVRLWNISKGKQQFQMLVCDTVYQPKSKQGKRTSILCVAFHPSGREFVVGTSCGTVQVYNTSTKSSVRPTRVLYSVHGDGKSVSTLIYNLDGTKIATRSANDNVVKVWDATKMNSSSIPLVVCHEADTIHEHANIAFSPDGKVLCIGVASLETDVDGKVRRERGCIRFYDVSVNNPSCYPLLTVPVNIDGNDVGAILVVWHPKINQILVGCSNGQMMVYFDTTISQNGAVCWSGKVRQSVDGLTELLRSRAPTGSAAITGEIMTPLYNPNLGQKRKRNDIIEEVQTYEPERPASSKHKVGGLASAGSVSFQQYVADTNNNKNSSKIIAGKDPREALFQYNEGKAFVDRAYEGNKSKLADKTAEQEDEEAKLKRKGFFDR
jgi:WD repeat-containing protein 70